MAFIIIRMYLLTTFIAYDSNPCFEYTNAHAQLNFTWFN